MTLNQLAALAALGFGLVGLLSHVLHALGRPTPAFSKLEPMQAKFGRALGTTIHFIAYALAPLAVALVFWLADA
jgi:hypothetical protein